MGCLQAVCIRQVHHAQHRFCLLTPVLFRQALQLRFQPGLHHGIGFHVIRRNDIPGNVQRSQQKYCNDPGTVLASVAMIQQCAGLLGQQQLKKTACGMLGLLRCDKFTVNILQILPGSISRSAGHINQGIQHAGLFLCCTGKRPKAHLVIA